MPRELRNLPPHRLKLYYAHPSTRKGRDVYDVEEWKSSVYYYWWEYLRRHEGYKASCENDAKGEYADLFAKFGNIHATDFVTWWHGGGRALFVEPTSEFQVREVTSEDDEQDYDDARFIILEVPLNRNLPRLLKQFETIVKNRQKERGGKFHHHSFTCGISCVYQARDFDTAEGIRSLGSA